jgi:UDP-N-acetylglucosamine 2-epimerase (non-hydrolysing)
MEGPLPCCTLTLTQRIDGNMKILIVYGTRPEAIKLAPVIQEINKLPDVQTTVCVTAQHRGMLDQVNRLFNLKIDHDLDLMLPDQSLAEVSARVLTHITPVIDQEAPDWVVVQGDTTSAALTALAAYYMNVPVAHVEAGLRTGDKRQPFPEEINRRMTAILADLHFAPTQQARKNLLDEGVAPETIEVTGNTIVDSLQAMAKLPLEHPPKFLNKLPQDQELILLTAHRRENFGQPLENIFKAVKRLAEIFTGRVHFLYPVHLNPRVQEPAHRLLDGIPNVTLTEPLDYHTFVHLLQRCKFVLTDSGGIQEEAPSFGKPVLVLREVTERHEGLEAGIARLVGASSTDRIVAQASLLLDDPDLYHQMSTGKNPYGDGHAAERIAGKLTSEI